MWFKLNFSNDKLTNIHFRWDVVAGVGVNSGVHGCCVGGDDSDVGVVAGVDISVCVGVLACFTIGIDVCVGATSYWC